MAVRECYEIAYYAIFSLFGLPHPSQVSAPCSQDPRFQFRVECCWSSPAHSFLAPGPVVLMTICFCLTTPSECMYVLRLIWTQEGRRDRRL
jgi:hypothetical protein